MGRDSGRIFAFSVFVFNSQTGELRRNGRTVRMPYQTARLLTALIENSGVMITREELRSRLWPDGEMLDYDQSINRIVSQLRTILGERSTKSDQYIDTLPKRGYRFKADVRVIPAPESTPAADSNRSLQSVRVTFADASVEHPPAPEKFQPPVFPSETSLTRVDTVPLPEAAESAPLRTSLLRSRLSRLAIAGGCLCLLLAVGLWYLYAHRPQPRQLLSLGIVPFEATGENASSLAESFRLDLADTLSQVPGIEIRAAHSFDNPGRDESQIRSRAVGLQVAALLFGKFDVQGDRCFLQLELVRSADGVHLSSFHYSGTVDELAAIRDRLQRDIFVRLNPSGPLSGLNASSSPSPKAYAAYLRGRYLLSLWTDDSLTNAIASFRESLQSDPGYARAYAGMASAYFVLAQHGAMPTKESIPRARQYAAKALSLDPSLAEAYAILGQVSLNEDWNFPLAEEQLQRAVELDPYHAIYRLWLSVLYCEEGKSDLALQQIDKAHAADPSWAPVYMTEVFVAGSANQFVRSDHAAKTLIQMMPGWPLAHEQNALNLWNFQHYAEAIDEWKIAATMEKNAARIQLEEQGATALRTGGVAAYARLRLHAIATRRGVSHEETDFIPAEWHAYAGDRDAAMAELEEMVKQHSQDALQISANPAYTPLHGTPRYENLMKNVGLPTSAIDAGRPHGKL